MESVMFRIENERVNGDTNWVKRSGVVLEWRSPEDADAYAERLWQLYGDGETYVRFSVVEDTGMVYTDWEV
jgi:hypothetical protein